MALCFSSNLYDYVFLFFLTEILISCHKEESPHWREIAREGKSVFILQSRDIMFNGVKQVFTVPRLYSALSVQIKNELNKHMGRDFG